MSVLVVLLLSMTVITGCATMHSDPASAPSARPTTSGTLSPTDAERLQVEVEAMIMAIERGDVEALIKLTHHALQDSAGGPEAFAKSTQQAVASLRQRQVKFLGTEIGTPTRIYPAGDEEVCFVPKVSIIEIKGEKVKSTAYMIAVRNIGGTAWKFMDGTGLRTRPETLYELLPELQRGITPPPIYIEPM